MSPFPCCPYETRLLNTTGERSYELRGPGGPLPFMGLDHTNSPKLVLIGLSGACRNPVVV